jgi:hypothetical protein
LWGIWGQQDAPDVRSWPAWSPDGQRLAAFRIARDGSEPRPVVVDASGVSAAEGTCLDGRAPIYLQWSREGDALAVLSKSDNELVLDQLDPADLEHGRPVLHGTPLFFQFLRGGRIAAFVGEKGGPTMLVLSPRGDRIELPGVPGNFCAPVEMGDDLVYVAHDRGRVAVVVGRSHGSGLRELEIVDGLVAIIGSADGRTLARAVAPDGEDSAYRDLRLIDLDSGRTRRVSDADCVAFFFAREDLVVARRHPHRETIAWMWVSRDGRDERLIAELHPSRDLRFWLRFFEQYSPSHPILSPDASTLLLSGGLVGGPDPRGAPRVWAVPIHGGDPVEVDNGPFATFSPAPAPVH